MRVLPRSFVAVAVLVFALGSCSQSRVRPAPGPDQATGPIPDCFPVPGYFNIKCAAYPDTNPVKQPDWDYFAWNSFVAANWPAVDPEKNNEQRGIPDLKQSFIFAQPDSLLTWETYKEKREVFFYPPGTPAQPSAVWNQEPKYGPVTPDIPLCSGHTDRSAHPRRLFGQGGKVPFNSLDETVEVASEALETQAQMCTGVPNPQCGTAQQNDCCLVPSLPVGPRVWKGEPSAGQPVVYEVKVNYDFFRYVNAGQLYLDPKAAAAAKAGAITLPYRTSAPNGPSSNNTNRVLNYNALTAHNSYANVSPTGNLLPYPSGAIHLKAAWILLKNEDRSRYHTTEAAYFRNEKNGQKCMAYGMFGLVGLHIIQRIHQNDGQQPTGTGGTFIFATWEHVDNDTAGFRYANFFVGKPLEHSHPAKGFYPPAATLPVQRQFPILPGTAAVNSKVHSIIRILNGRSVWLNYKLVGVQFRPLDVLPPGSGIANPNDPTNIGQPLFLANSVIETNLGLQHFQGLPPSSVPIDKYKNTIRGNTTVLSFIRNTPNVTFQRTGYNMGGCMGCHGVAQTKGFSFSFVLLGGQRGADVDTETQFTVPPPFPAPPPSP
jgi:hypothetical protein